MDWSSWLEVDADSARLASSAAILCSTVGGGVCGIDPGGKRRKKFSRGFGRVCASF